MLIQQQVPVSILPRESAMRARLHSVSTLPPHGLQLMTRNLAHQCQPFHVTSLAGSLLLPVTAILVTVPSRSTRPWPTASSLVQSRPCPLL